MYNSCGPPPSSVGYQRLCGGAPPPLQFRSGSSQMWHTTVMVPTQHWGAVGYFPAIVTRPSQLNFSGSYDPVAWSGPPSYPGQFAAGNRRQLGQQEQYRQPYSNYHNQPQPHRQMHAQPPYMAHRMTVNAVTYGFGDPTLGVYRTSADGWKYRGAYGGGRRPSPPFQAMVTRPLVSSNGRRRRGTHARANMAGGWGDLDTDDLYAFEAGENLDVDNMSYEELLELTERLGMVERGVQPARLNELRVVITPTHVKQQLESDRMVAGRNGLVKGGANIDQEEKEANEKMCEEDPIKCCICLDGVLVGQTVTRMPCCRNFLHASCAAPWFESHFRCPICKSDIRGGDH
ncbi:hypothetical protein, conserved [Trypanosoma brucei gambiense DAL972]|uniref:RING-type E3 ubiquitin transferase n=1 Tax=Trypanosoma brucei gambiense (strain MHOM/CI/86/DAL972) TaxID=679716 RepID=D0A6K7_TRYB9|nr:hypothetical protein, conserved [Trypanosoma brucei gambiense DAL972]CBH17308.1 hypothetical protein, conserved [Trypanosoma brucei gambiense DAL972]|eukprot:XP_011779572.1 hypothetical protein, conserved [Trypanosoma brucei gambiense DAL972]